MKLSIQLTWMLSAETRTFRTIFRRTSSFILSNFNSFQRKFSH